jgi:hypothetical protein
MALFQNLDSLENRFYVYTLSDPGRGDSEEVSSLFEQSGSRWFISFEQMKEIKSEDLLVLRVRM